MDIEDELVNSPSLLNCGLGETEEQKKHNSLLDKMYRDEKPLLVGKMNEENNKLNYNFYDLERTTNEKKTGETPFECIDENKLDYPIEIVDELKAGLNNPKPAFITKDDKPKIPISFLSIREGEIEKGKEWYIKNDPKLPNEIAELMARYSWGDLKNMTKKEAKNRRKKLNKKGKDILDNDKLAVKHGNFKINFE